MKENIWKYGKMFFKYIFCLKFLKNIVIKIVWLTHDYAIIILNF